MFNKRIVLVILLILVCNNSYASKYGVLVLPNGVKVQIDADKPVYLTKIIDGQRYYWVYDPQTKKVRPAKYTVDSSKYNEIIEEAAMTHGVNPKLIRCVIKHESGFNPTAISPAGARGLMQLIPSTARSMGVDDVYDPRQNVMGGTKYLRKLLDMFQGNPVLAVAAYNAGENRIYQYQGVPPFAETKAYVDKVITDFASLN